MSLAENLGSPSTSFSEELRSRSDAELTSIFVARPDLISPVPADLVTLATRATSAPSLLRAIDSLDQFHYQILLACAVLEDPFTIKELVEITNQSAEKALLNLYQLGLAYKDGKKYRLPRALREVIGNEPAGLGPRSASPLDFEKLAKAPKGATEILERLTWGPPRGNLVDSRVKGGPIDWLLDNHYLIPIDSKTFSLPLQLGLHLRDGKVHRELLESPPALEGKQKKSEEIERAALASIANILRWVQELMNFWSEETPAVIQSGGVGVRDLKKAAEHLDLSETCAAFVAELSYITGLCAIDGGSILPTATFDLWQNKNPEARWREIAELWLITSRVSGLVGRSEARNITALGNELDRVNATKIRSRTLEVLGQCEKGLAPTLESLRSAVIWHYPHKRGISITSELVEWTLREAEWLGITGAGALSSFGARFISGKSDLKINPSLPKPVDHILIQSDNTAIAPGPLTTEIAEHLSTFADIESRGSATVYRFSESSIRRGLDHGHTGEEIKSFLAKTSRTPIPQPLEYLIADVAKKHGRLRVGNSHSYLRSEDLALITAILADKRFEPLGLRQIAPQVLVADVESSLLLEELRAAGYFPAGESSRGAIVSAPLRRRAKAKPRPPRVLGEIASPSPEMIETAIKVLRTGERASIRRTTRELPRTTAEQTLEILNEYVGKGIALQIGYADTNGAVTLRVIDPLSISLGTLIARDHTTNGVTPFKIARITGVAIA